MSSKKPFFANSESEEKHLMNSVRVRRHAGYDTGFMEQMKRVTEGARNSSDPKLRELMKAFDEEPSSDSTNETGQG